MKNIIKNFIRTILIFVIAFVTMSGLTQVAAATTAPDKITTGGSSTLPGYVAGVYFGTKKSTDGKYLYCTDIHKSTPKNMTLTRSGTMDAGLTYIMLNGYPNKKFTGNSNYDYYITQTAVWWYLDSTTGSNNLSDTFKTNGSDPHNLRPHIKKLVQDGIAAKNKGYTKPTVTLNSSSTSLTKGSDGYYYSSYITVGGTSLTGKIVIGLTNAPSGAVLVNTSGKAVTSVAAGTKVRIKIAASSMDKLSYSMTVKATATGSITKAYLYKPSNNAYQPVTVAVPFKETTSVSTSKTFTYKTTVVKITKIDSATNKAIAGAKLVLKNASGTVVASWTSTNGTHVIKGLKAGTYTLEETEAPNGYVLNKNKEKVVIKEGQTTIVKFYNTKKQPTKVTIIKRDSETNKTLAGAVFVLKNSKGEQVAKWTSTTKGHFVQGLPEGKYYLSEESAPAGYVKSDETKEITLTAGKDVTVTFFNTKKEPTKVTIIKRDADTKETLAGAVFVLKNSKGEQVAKWTSTTKGHFVQGLPEGKYYLSEESAPAGYVKSDETQEITLVSGKEVTVTFYNNKKVNKTVIKITKINGETGKALEGADLVLKDKDGNIKATWTTTKEAYVISDLEVGTYYLSETKAPKGYVLSKEVIKITVAEDNDVQNVVFKNVPEVEVPDTGSSVNITAIIAGVITIVTGGIVLFVSTKREA